MFNWCLITQTFKEVLPSSLCMLNCVRLFETLWTVPHQAPLSMGFFILLQARMLEWVAIPPPGDLPNPGINTGIKSESLTFPTLANRFFTTSATWEAQGLHSPRNSPGQNTGVGSRSPLQRIFPTQRWNPSVPHCGRSLYQLSHQGGLKTLEWVAYSISGGSS